MKRFGLLLFLILPPAAPAWALGRLAEVSIVDRDTGEVLRTHFHAGEYWIEGRPGARYAIRIRNNGGQRLLAVTSVDGVNVVTGETAAYDQRGYVFEPWSGYEVAGWRKSDAQVAAFVFTSVPRSYAARTGRPENVGVIGVALFRERAPQLSMQGKLQDSETLRRSETAAAASARAPTTLPAPAPAPALGTGHGRREASRVTQVDFVREQAHPNEVIRVRYDSRANLVARGVLPGSPRGGGSPQPFPSSGPQLGYVPDP